MSKEAVAVKVTMLADVRNLGNFRNTLGKEELSLLRQELLSVAMAAPRDSLGRFLGRPKSRKVPGDRSRQTVVIDHNYESGHTCYADPCQDPNCPLFNNIRLGKFAERESWKEGRRIVEFGELLSNLKQCKRCKLGPVPLTYNNVVGELRTGLGGYLYVKCLNVDCGEVNLIPYGKTHRIKTNTPGLPCFVVNTKLGTG